MKARPDPNEIRTGFEISEDIGEIERNLGNRASSRLVICVKDLHGHLGVQRNIAAILEKIVSHGTRLIGTEGAVGPGDFRHWTAMPFHHRWAEADRQLKQGNMVAVEYFMATRNPAGVVTYGIDDAALYEQQNTVQYLAFRHVGPLVSLCSQLTQILQVACQPYLSANFEALYSAFVRHEDLSQDSFPFAEMAIRRAQLLGITVPDKVLDAKEKKVRYRAWQREESARFATLPESLRSALERYGRARFDVLQDLPAEVRHRAEESEDGLSVIWDVLDIHARSMVSEAASDLEEESKRYRSGMIQSISKSGSSPPEPSNFQLALNYADETCWTILQKLAEGQPIDEAFRRLILEISYVRRFFLREMTADESARVMKGGHEGIRKALSDGLALLSQLLPRERTLSDFDRDSLLRQIEAYWELPKEYYELSRLRSSQMARNMASLMRERDQNVAALVSGGFHSRDIIQSLIKEEDFAAIAITPNVDKLDDEYRERYRTVIVEDNESPSAFREGLTWA